MGFWNWLVSNFSGGGEQQTSEPAAAPPGPRGEYVKENPWGIREGMSLKEVDRILAKNGFQQVDVDDGLGADPPGYSYPCWRNSQKRINVTSNFKDGRLLEFTWLG